MVVIQIWECWQRSGTHCRHYESPRQISTTDTCYRYVIYSWNMAMVPYRIYNILISPVHGIEITIIVVVPPISSFQNDHHFMSYRRSLTPPLWCHHPPHRHRRRPHFERRWILDLDHTGRLHWPSGYRYPNTWRNFILIGIRLVPTVPRSSFWPVLWIHHWPNYPHDVVTSMNVVRWCLSKPLLPINNINWNHYYCHHTRTNHHVTTSRQQQVLPRHVAN